jgi:hypothetical protein
MELKDEKERKKRKIKHVNVERKRKRVEERKEGSKSVIEESGVCKSSPIDTE